MAYMDDALVEELDNENEKKSAKEILNKKKLTGFEMDMLFIDEEEEESEEDPDRFDYGDE